jgi:membrane protein CcdC involved in cytochrome C biogenesis
MALGRICSSPRAISRRFKILPPLYLSRQLSAGFRAPLLAMTSVVWETALLVGLNLSVKLIFSPLASEPLKPTQSNGEGKGDGGKATSMVVSVGLLILRVLVRTNPGEQS